MVSYMDEVLFDADCLLAESCLAVYEVDNQMNEDSKPHTTNTQNQSTNTNNQQSTKPNVQSNNNNTQNGKPPIAFTKADLDDPQKVKQILDKAKREKNFKTIKMVLRSSISLGALALTSFAAAPLAVTSAASILANLGISMNDQKHAREISQMVSLIDDKIAKLNAEMLTERDPEKQKAQREYLNSLKQAKMKLKNA